MYNNTRARFNAASSPSSNNNIHHHHSNSHHVMNTPSSMHGDTLLPSINPRKSSPRKSYSAKDGGFNKSSLLLCLISLTLFCLCIYLVFTRKCATRSDYEALEAEHELLKMKLSEAKSISLNLKAKHQRRSKVLQNLYTSNSKLRVMLKEVCMVHVPDALKHEKAGLDDFNDVEDGQTKKKDKNNSKTQTLAKNKKMQEAKLEVDHKKKPNGPS